MNNSGVETVIIGIYATTEDTSIEGKEKFIDHLQH